MPKKLVQEGLYTQQEADLMLSKFMHMMEADFESASSFKPNKADWLEGAWAGFAQMGDEEEYRDDKTGGSFTITNGGIYGSMLSTPFLNAPQSGILGMHNIKQRAVVLDDSSVVSRPIMYLALSYDHRIVDGRQAVTFLVRVKEAIEDPSRLLIET
ncbi:MAG: hypothetical protein EXQ84_02720 [Rhodospirillaceae bacterium]|nr:hypothetical protein [Rhodospirillaceae bacterium]